MGFYGNIRNATNNSFKFDRIYSNRTLMEQNEQTDGVFGGRYVLVEYDQKLNENPADGVVLNIYTVRTDTNEQGNIFTCFDKYNGVGTYTEPDKTLTRDEVDLLVALKDYHHLNLIPRDTDTNKFKFDEETDTVTIPGDTYYYLKFSVESYIENGVLKDGFQRVYYHLGNKLGTGLYRGSFIANDYEDNQRNIGAYDTELEDNNIIKVQTYRNYDVVHEIRPGLKLKTEELANLEAEVKYVGGLVKEPNLYKEYRLKDDQEQDLPFPNDPDGNILYEKTSTGAYRPTEDLTRNLAKTYYRKTLTDAEEQGYRDRLATIQSLVIQKLDDRVQVFDYIDVDSAYNYITIVDDEGNPKEYYCYVRSDRIPTKEAQNSKGEIDLSLIMDNNEVWYLLDNENNYRPVHGDEEDAYTVNYNIDKMRYGAGRGFDSTV